MDAPLEPVDPLENDDARYLTLRFDRKFELRRIHLDDPQISRMNEESVELISYVTKGTDISRVSSF